MTREAEMGAAGMRRGDWTGARFGRAGQTGAKKKEGRKEGRNVWKTWQPGPTLVYFFFSFPSFFFSPPVIFVMWDGMGAGRFDES